jgi:hypothetical protein
MALRVRIPPSPEVYFADFRTVSEAVISEDTVVIRVQIRIVASSDQ